MDRPPIDLLAWLFANSGVLVTQEVSGKFWCACCGAESWRCAGDITHAPLYPCKFLNLAENERTAPDGYAD